MRSDNEIRYIDDDELFYNEILNDPKKMIHELYDVQDRERMKIGEFEEFYDPARRKKQPALYLERFYGKALFNRFKREVDESKDPTFGRKEGHVTKELYGIMRDFCKEKGVIPDDPVTFDEGIETPAKKQASHAKEAEAKIITISPELIQHKDIQRERKSGDDYFMMLERGLFLNPTFRKLFKGPFTVYGWLWSNIVRKGWEDKPGYPIKAEYYKKGLLAYCASYSHIGKKCFLNKDTVKKYIDELCQYGVIKQEFILPSGKVQQQGVYILGEWREIKGKIRETFYLAQVFLSGKVDAPW